MTQKMFYIDALQYRNKLREAVLNAEGGERLGNPDLSDIDSSEVYFLPKNRVTLLYAGKNTITFAGNNEVAIRRTKSRLERASGTKLTEMKHG